MRSKLSLAVAATVLGVSLGWVATASAAEDDKCYKNQCSLDSGNCFPTDIQFNCGEIVGGNGCQADKCKPS